MNVIFKYPLIELMPINIVEARIVCPLRVDFQNGDPFLWAVVSDEVPKRKIQVFRIGTGHPMDGDIHLNHYLNTTVAQSEPYVWHWFWEDTRG